MQVKKPDCCCGGGILFIYLLLFMYLSITVNSSMYMFKDKFCFSKTTSYKQIFVLGFSWNDNKNKLFFYKSTF